ncbi:MAG: arsenosugar biosynthesis radical SAM protein ArsS [Synergistaceae bacterium]|jgi:radical SAM/Cys-rich protein|nr:arsenosugar biosynthesis radical SAM protein ArsS [Synergistaceae bacterium]
MAEAKIPPFETLVPEELSTASAAPSTLQINLGRRCPLSCRHCHLEAGPERGEVMGDDVLDACLKLSRDTVDITGGAPELHPRLRDFIRAVRPLCRRLILRTNLVLLVEPGYGDLPALFRENRVELACSLPHYIADATDRVRGSSVFARSIEALRRLNSLGYGIDKYLMLNLVFNPGGAVLPPAQSALEAEYRAALMRDFGVSFSSLLTITNVPLGRFRSFLEAKGVTAGYMERLYRAFNPAALPGMMCRDQISVGWDGRIYDCDFNQAAELPTGLTVFDALVPRKIRFGQHCYACAAGQGSSCGGATV